MSRVWVAVATVLVGTALMAQVAAADSSTTTTTTAETTTMPAPAAPAQPPATGVTVTPTPAPLTPPTVSPSSGQGKGGGNHHQGGSSGQTGGHKSGKGSSKKTGAGNGQAPARATLSPAGSPISGLGSSLIPGPTCGTTVTAPAGLMPIYQQASDTYGLGPQGPGVLAAINGIESDFGANLGPSSAGAVGWMQFEPSTWAIYGVDADGDGVANPNDPRDAIFAAASYLRAAGMPSNTPGAIFAYNHADWYVSEVLANAGCYGGSGGFAGSLMPASVQTMTCNPAKGAHVPEPYMAAFEDAASRYQLGQRGVWVLASIARLESNFGRGMTAAQLVSAGPLGLDRNEWNRFEVDGDSDGQINHADIYDSAATLAREIWSQGSLQAGIFLHNQAQWYVQQVLDQANQMAGRCTTGTAALTVALPETASGLVSSNPLPGWQRGRIDMGVDFSAASGTPILAPFDAVVVRVGAPGWPGGGGGVLLHPAHGQYVYIYESVQALVSPGQQVQAGQVIGTASATSESTGIEVGFADSSGAPLAHGVYREGDVTAWGQRMAQFLTELGAP